MKVRTRSKKVDKAWLQSHVNDPYVKLAAKEGYRARAAYKLKEIDDSLHLLHPGQVVVDLGSAPGAWSQYVRRRFAKGDGIDGTVIALDLLPMEPVANVQFLLGDFREDATLEALTAVLAGRRVDVVVSDMAPNLSGIESSDAARMAHLVDLALDFSAAHLKPDGALVTKMFHGSGFAQSVQRFKSVFQLVKPLKPKASRDKSAETFMIGRHLKRS
ncbi:MAG: RlmE family RNA methyltransferase [Aquabacterium sp.]